MKKKNGGLGRGLDAIFLENAPADDRGIGTVIKLRISMVDPRADQPRRSFDKEALEGLAESIREHGLLQPILVRESEGGRYQIIAGERRFRACKLAELTEIPAIILDKDDMATAQIALIENIQREDLNPIEEAMAYRALATEYGMTQEELAAKVGKSRSAIANATRLLELPEEVLQMVAQGTLSAGHARTLLGCKNKEDIPVLAALCVERGLSVRAVEEAVKLANRQKRDAQAKEEAPLPLVNYMRQMELRIESHLGRKVTLGGHGKKRTLTIYYEDNEDLDALLTDICGKEFMEEDS